MLTFIMLLKSCLNLLDGLKKNVTYRFLCMPTICFWQEKKGHPLGRNELVYRYRLHVPATGWLFVSEGQNEHPSPVISSSFFLFSWEFVSLRVCGALLSVCLACLSDEILSHLSVCQRWVSERAVDELSVSGRVMGKNILLKKFSDLHEYSWGTYDEYHWKNFTLKQSFPRSPLTMLIKVSKHQKLL